MNKRTIRFAAKLCGLLCVMAAFLMLSAFIEGAFSPLGFFMLAPAAGMVGISMLRFALMPKKARPAPGGARQKKAFGIRLATSGQSRPGGRVA